MGVGHTSKGPRRCRLRPSSEELDLDVCLPNSGHVDERHSAHFERYGQVRIWQFGFAFTTSSRNSNQ